MCNHPYLFPGAEPGPPFEEGEHIVHNSGKLVLLDRLLHKLRAGRHKVLLFSQSTAMLDVLQVGMQSEAWVCSGEGALYWCALRPHPAHKHRTRYAHMPHHPMPSSACVSPGPHGARGRALVEGGVVFRMTPWGASSARLFVVVCALPPQPPFLPRPSPPPPKDYVTYRRWPYERLDGSVRSEERWQGIGRFQADGGDDTFVFLLSTRAGGVGINLTAADTVILYDSDW